MAHKRKRGKGWAYIIKRADVLPKPLHLTFDDEAEGDEYVRRVEVLLDHGIACKAAHSGSIPLSPSIAVKEKAP